MSKKSKNFLVKALAISIILSFMPLISKVVVPDYKGFDLEAAEEKKKKKRKRVKLPSKKAQKILQTVQPLLESESWDEALAMLSVMETDPKFTGTDRARMLWYHGYIYFSQEKYDSAIRVYKRLLNEPDADYKIQNQARYSLAQLSFINEDYKNSIKYLLEWIEEEEEPSAQGYSLLATAYFQTADLREQRII